MGDKARSQQLYTLRCKPDLLLSLGSLPPPADLCYDLQVFQSQPIGLTLPQQNGLQNSSVADSSMRHGLAPRRPCGEGNEWLDRAVEAE